MMPPTLLAPEDELRSRTLTTPELRRMEMFNRARREEMDAMLYSVNARQSAGTQSSRRHGNDATIVSRFLNGLRNGIGNALVTAGNRIQSPA